MEQATQHKGSVADTTQLEAEYPSYIHELYRYAKKTLGNQARYEDLAKCMNARSRVAGEERHDTKFNKDYLLTEMVHVAGRTGEVPD